MALPHPDSDVQVDMVPLIDIISLLLMFLVIVGDGAARNSNVDMVLPRADQARREETQNAEGRIVIQLQKFSDGYAAVVNGETRNLRASPSEGALTNYLEQQVCFAVEHGYTQRESDGSVRSPVKLRIPGDAPMTEVQRVVLSCAKVGLVNVQYAALKPE